MQSSSENKGSSSWNIPSKTPDNLYLPPQAPFLGIALEVDTNATSWVGREVNELKHYPDKNTRNCIGHAEFVLSYGVKLDDSTFIVTFLLYQLFLRQNNSLPQLTC